MSGQLIFNSNLDIVSIATVNYTVDNFLQRTATDFYFARSTTSPLVIPPEAQDLLIAINISISTDTVGLTVSNILTAIIWSNVPCLEPLGAGQVQFTCDEMVFSGLQYTGGNPPAGLVESLVIGPNATNTAPLLTRREAAGIHAAPLPNTLPQNRIRNPWASGSGTPIPVPGILPNLFQFYIQADTSADFVASTNPVFDVELQVYGIVQT